MKKYDGITHKTKSRWIWNSSTFDCLGWCEGRTCEVFL